MARFFWGEYNSCDLRTIYFLINTGSKLAYVGQTMRPEERYKEHLRGSSEVTKDYSKDMDFIEVEKLILNKHDAYALELVWIRILRENGFTVINSAADIRNSKNIFHWYLPKYKERKEVNIYELCNHQK